VYGPENFYVTSCFSHDYQFTLVEYIVQQNTKSVCTTRGKKTDRDTFLFVLVQQRQGEKTSKTKLIDTRNLIDWTKFTLKRGQKTNSSFYTPPPSRTFPGAFASSLCLSCTCWVSIYVYHRLLHSSYLYLHLFTVGLLNFSFLKDCFCCS